MSQEERTPDAPKTHQEQIADVVSRLKQMEHYSRSNIEALSQDWLLLDDTLKEKAFAALMDKLMSAQNKFQDVVLEALDVMESAAEPT
jgi:hypothetical protein